MNVPTPYNKRRKPFVYAFTLLLSIIMLFHKTISKAQLLPPLTSQARTILAESSRRTQLFRLTNGLQLLVREDHRAPIVISQIWYRVGSIDEPHGQTGLAHALEHMMFRGTPLYPHNRFSELIDKNGGQQNAMTSYDYTVYYQRLSNKNLALSFRLEADRMRHLSLNPNDFKQERQIVMEERRMRTTDNPQALTLERWLAVAYMASPYHHPVIGWPFDLTHLNVHHLSLFYHTWYAPNNAVVVVVGDVDPQAVYRLAKHYFGSLKARSLPQHPPSPPSMMSWGQRTVTVHHPAKNAWVVLGFNVPSWSQHHLDSREPYALALLQTILDGYPSSRLRKNLVLNITHTALETSCSYDLYTRYSSLFSLSGTPGPQHTPQQLMAAFWKQIHQLQTLLISDQELKKAQTQWIAHKIYQRDSLFNQAFELGQLLTLGLPWQRAEQDIDIILSLTPSYLRTIAQRYFIPQKSTSALLIPQPLHPHLSNNTTRSAHASQPHIIL